MINDNPCFIFQWFPYQIEKLYCVNCELSLACKNQLFCFLAGRILPQNVLKPTVQLVLQFCLCPHWHKQNGEVHCLQKDCIAWASRLEFSKQFRISQNGKWHLQLISSNSGGLEGVKCTKALYSSTQGSEKNSKQICWVGCWHIL